MANPRAIAFNGLGIELMFDSLDTIHLLFLVLALALALGI